MILFSLTDINECLNNEAGCFSAALCNDLTPANEADAFFTCECEPGYELYTANGQNGFGMTVQYGEDVKENVGEQRVIGKSCVRKFALAAAAYLYDW